MFRLTNVIPERIIFVSRGITVYGICSCLSDFLVLSCTDILINLSGYQGILIKLKLLVHWSGMVKLCDNIYFWSPCDKCFACRVTFLSVLMARAQYCQDQPVELWVMRWQHTSKKQICLWLVLIWVEHQLMWVDLLVIMNMCLNQPLLESQYKLHR